MESLGVSLEANNKEQIETRLDLAKVTQELKTWQQTMCEPHDKRIQQNCEAITQVRIVAASVAVKTAIITSIGLAALVGLIGWAFTQVSP
jgi:hypothetical protein